MANNKKRRLGLSSDTCFDEKFPCPKSGAMWAQPVIISDTHFQIGVEAPSHLEVASKMCIVLPKKNTTEVRKALRLTCINICSNMNRPCAAPGGMLAARLLSSSGLHRLRSQIAQSYLHCSKPVFAISYQPTLTTTRWITSATRTETTGNKVEKSLFVEGIGAPKLPQPTKFGTSLM